MRNQYATAVDFIEPSGDKRVDQMTLSEVSEFGDRLIDKTRGRADLGLPPELGSSAKGAYQMTNPFLSDWASSLYGDGYEDKVFNQQTQDEIMSHYLSKVEPSTVYSNFEGLKKAGITPDIISQLSPEDTMAAIRATETGSGLEDGWLEAKVNPSPSERGLASESVANSVTNTNRVAPEGKPPEGLGEFAARNTNTIPSTSTAGKGIQRTASTSNRERGRDGVELLSYYAPKDTEGLAKKADEELREERKKKVSKGFSNLKSSLQGMGLSSTTNLASNTASQNTPVSGKKINSKNRLHF